MDRQFSAFEGNIGPGLSHRDRRGNAASRSFAQAHPAMIRAGLFTHDSGRSGYR